MNRGNVREWGLNGICLVGAAVQRQPFSGTEPPADISDRAPRTWAALFVPDVGHAAFRMGARQSWAWNRSARLLRMTLPAFRNTHIKGRLTRLAAKSAWRYEGEAGAPFNGINAVAPMPR